MISFAGSVFEARRIFVVWSYSVSHSSLLLVSLPTDEYAKRISIIFRGVENIILDVRFNLSEIRVYRDKEGDLVKYELVSDGKTYVVNALAAYVVDDYGDYSDPIDSWE